MNVETIPIDQITIGERARRELRKIESLAKSIRERGLLQPIVVRPTKDGYALVAGGRRIEAHRLLGRAAIEAHVAESLADELEALLAENDENTEREDFTPTEAVEHGERIRALIEARAAQRRRAGQEAGRAAQAKARQERASATPQLAFVEPKPSERAEVVVGNFPTTTPPVEQVHTRQEIAKSAGMSDRTWEKARHVVQTARDPQAPEPVRAAAREAQAAMDRTGKVDPAFKKVREAEAAHAVKPVADYLEASGGAEELRRMRWQANFQGDLAKAFGLLGKYRPEQVAASADDDLLEELRRISTRLTSYIAEVEALRTRPAGLSLVSGG